MTQRLFLAWIAIVLVPSIANAQSPSHRGSIDLKGSIGYTGVFDDDASHVSGGIGTANGRSVFAQGGVGMKIPRGSWFIAPDVRFGYYYHIRASIGFGCTFGAARR